MSSGFVGFPAVTGNGLSYYMLVAGTGASAPLWWWNADSIIYSVDLTDTTATDVPDGVTAVTTAIGSGPGDDQYAKNQDWCYDATTATVWAAVYDSGVQKLAEIDPSDGSFTLHTVTDIDRCWVDGSDRLWIRRDTDKSVIERLDKGALTGTALETREFNVNVEYLVFVGLDAYVVDRSTLTLRWYPDGGSLQTLAVTSSGPYLRYMTHDPDRGSLWIVTGGTAGTTHYLHEFSLSSETIVQDITLTDKLTTYPPAYSAGKLYFFIGYTFGSPVYPAVHYMNTSTNAFTVLADLEGIIYNQASILIHPNGSLYLNGYTQTVDEWAIYKLDTPAAATRRPNFVRMVGVP